MPCKDDERIFEAQYSRVWERQRFARLLTGFVELIVCKVCTINDGVVDKETTRLANDLLEVDIIVAASTLPRQDHALTLVR